MAKRNPYAEHEPASGSGGFVKFEDNKQVRVRIVSDPAIFDNVFKGNVSTKYAWLVFDTEDETIKIMQLPKGGYRSLMALATDEDYGNPMENNYLLKITRTGKEFQTKYNMTAVNKQVQLTQEAQDELDEMDLIARLEQNDNNENVAWLFDEIDGKRSKTTIDQKDKVVDVDEDEEINLDDVPL